MIENGINIEFVPKSDLPIVEVIHEFISDLFAKQKMAVCGFGCALLFVLKDIAPDDWEQIQKMENIEDLTIPNVIQLVKEWGVKYPFIQTSEKHGTVSIMYSQNVILYFQHPQFFDHLEAVLKHVAKNDDLSQFSLRPGTVSSSDHD